MDKMSIKNYFVDHNIEEIIKLFERTEKRVNDLVDVKL